MSSNVTVVNNTVWAKLAKRVDLSHSYHTHTHTHTHKKSDDGNYVSLWMY